MDDLPFTCSSPGGRPPEGDASLPKVLALDTTAGSCSVALLSGGVIVQTVDPAPGPHSRQILARIRQVLAQTGLAGAELDAIAFGAGPGSFTGLRLACGVAQGLSLGWGLPVVPVSSMACLAMQALWAADASVRDVRVGVALDARMNECYVSCWESHHGKVTPVGIVSTCPVVGIAGHFERVWHGQPQSELLLAGDGFALVDAHLSGGRQSEPAFGAAQTSEALHPLAWAVARIAEQRLLQGLALDPAEVGPFYVRDKVALDVTEQAALRREHARERASQVVRVERA